jgi:hypothetical protein
LRALLQNRFRAAGDPHDSRDAGAATLFVIGLSTMLLVLAGLVVDGGLAINARAEAADVAEQAARAGAQEIDEGVLRDTGQIELGDGAVGRAEDFLFASGFVAGGGEVGEITVVGDEITVGVTRQYDTMLLSLIGFNTFNIAAEATARPAVGIDAEL